MSSQQFCLKWNNHTNNMLNVFESLLSTEALVDVTLACDGLSLKAHKMVLSACSPFFQSLFLENPCKHPIVIMKDMSYKDLKAIIDFMYRGEVNVSQDQLSALLKTAETLKVKGLAEVSGENRQSSGIVQQEITAPPQSTPAAPSQTQQQPQTRSESPPLHGKRKRGRPRKRSLSDSNRSDDDIVPSKIKDPDSPEIEELSGDASMEAGDSHRQGSNSSSQSQVHHSSVNFSSANHRQSISSHQNAHVEEPPSGDDNEFEVEPSKLLEQTLTTDNVPSMSNATTSISHSFPTSSGIEISQIGMGDSQALVPVSAASDSLSSSHMQGPDSPQDIKPAILTFDEPPISPVAGPSHQSDRSMMMYMDQSSMPGPSNFQDQSIVQHDSQPQGRQKVVITRVRSHPTSESKGNKPQEKLVGLPNIKHEFADIPAIPVTTFDALQELEKWSRKTENWDIMVSYLSRVGGANLKVTTRRILSRMVTNELATKMNWAGRGAKIGFGKFNLSKLVISAVQMNPRMQGHTEAEIENVIKSWLRFAFERLGAKRRPLSEQK